MRLATSALGVAVVLALLGTDVVVAASRHGSETARPRSVAGSARRSGPASAGGPLAGAARGGLPSPKAAFVPNRGQFPAGVRFAALRANEVIAAVPGGLLLVRSDAAGDSVVRIGLGGGAVGPVGEDPAEGRVHFLVGRETGAWVRDLPRLTAIRYPNAWPGIDVRVRPRNTGFAYDLCLAAGADPLAVEFAYEGALGLEPGIDGTLGILTPRGRWIESPPVAWQEGPDGRQFVSVRRVLRGPRRAGFALAAYDRSRPLLIDPTVTYGTYLGGDGSDGGEAIALGPDGSVYVAGTTHTLDFPTTPGAFDPRIFGASTLGFVTRFVPLVPPDPFGVRWLLGAPSVDYRLEYGTYLGGLDFRTKTSVAAMAVDARGIAYLTGFVIDDAGKFPTTPMAYDPTYHGGPGDAFVTALAPAGDSLVYSTFLGGSALDQGTGIAVDAAGAAYVAGITSSEGFPTSDGAFQTFIGGGQDGFVTKLDPKGEALAYSTYFGGSGLDSLLGIAVDAAGQAHVAGATESYSARDFLTTEGVYDREMDHRFGDAIVAALSADGATELWGTFLGGEGLDIAYAIALDGFSGVVVAGTTKSADFPLPGQPRRPFGRGRRGPMERSDAFVSRLYSRGRFLVASTLLRGSGDEAAVSVAIDRATVVVGGWTTSNDFPTTIPSRRSARSGRDGFAAALTLTMRYEFGALLGGRAHPRGFEPDPLGGRDEVTCVAVRDGLLYATGQTSTVDFPVTRLAFSEFLDEESDAFLTILKLPSRARFPEPLLR